MKIRTSLAALTIAALIVGPADHAYGGSPAKQAQNALKQKIEDAEDDLDDCYGHALDVYRDALKAIESAVNDAELTALQAVEMANEASANFATDLDSHATYVMSDVCVTATGLVNDLGFAPTGFLVNDCGAFDGFIAGVGKAQAKFGKKGLKKLKALLAKLEKLMKKSGVKVQVNVHIFVLVPPPPAPGPVAPAPTPLKFKSVSSAHDSNLANDGKLSVRGQGPKNGVVSVNITGPNGTNITKNVPTDANGCFQAGFPSVPGDGNPGTLPEGNYKITLTSGTQTASQFHGV